MEALLLGLGIGFGAGVSPGPLLALVCSATLERGLGAGLRVSAAPLLSDAPVIVLSLWALSRTPTWLFHAIGIGGGLFVIYLGLDTLSRSRNAELRPEAGGRGEDLLRGALINLLSPHPWLFWASVGGPLALRFHRQGLGRVLLFGLGFYLTLVGSKVMVAWGIDRGRGRLDQARFRLLLAGCGWLLLGLGGLLIWQGVVGIRG